MPDAKQGYYSQEVLQTCFIRWEGRLAGQGVLQRTLALGIEYLRDMTVQVGTQILSYPYLMAVSTLVTIPILFLFFLA